MIESMYTSNIADEVEDPPEPVKTAAALLNERNPLHKLEERLDSKHMITHNNWGIYFTTDEYWKFETPFQEDRVEEKARPSLDYEPGYEATIYTPNNETEEEISYSANVDVEIDENNGLPDVSVDFEDIAEEDITHDKETIISDIKLALEIESFVQKLIDKAG